MADGVRACVPTRRGPISASSDVLSHRPGASQGEIALSMEYQGETLQQFKLHLSRQDSCRASLQKTCAQADAEDLI